MNSVGKTSGDHAAGASRLLHQCESRQAQQGQAARGKHHSPADILGKQMKFSSDAQSDSLAADSDEADFLRSFSAAMQKNIEDGLEGAGVEADCAAADERVIAIAQQTNWTGLPSAATVQQTAATPSDIASLVNTVTQLIAKGISADAAPQAGQAAQFRFALPDGNLGISHIQIVMTSSTIDVVLERFGTVTGDTFAAAASTLADRLLTRFAKRSVRIMERVIDEPITILAEEAGASERQEKPSRS